MEKTVTLRFLRFDANMSARDPYSKTLNIVWEIVDDDKLGWVDDMADYDKVVHKIVPLQLEKTYQPTYTRR